MKVNPDPTLRYIGLAMMVMGVVQVCLAVVFFLR